MYPEMRTYSVDIDRVVLKNWKSRELKSGMCTGQNINEFKFQGNEWMSGDDYLPYDNECDASIYSTQRWHSRIRDTCVVFRVYAGIEHAWPIRPTW